MLLWPSHYRDDDDIFGSDVVEGLLGVLERI